MTLVVETYDFIGMHYVRSQAYSLQIAHILDECLRRRQLTELQVQAEYKRLTSHQDVAVFATSSTAVRGR